MMASFRQLLQLASIPKLMLRIPLDMIGAAERGFMLCGQRMTPIFFAQASALERPLQSRLDR